MRPLRQQFHRAGGTMLLFSLLLLCAGCGVTFTSPGTSTLFPTSTASSISTYSATTPTAPGRPATTATASTLAQNGCPAKQPPANADSQKVDVVAPQASAQPVTLRRDQVVEIQLSPALRWTTPPSDSAYLLTPLAGNGWFSARVGRCVWRYAATKAGSTTLTFIGSALCASGGPCRALAVAAEYKLTIQP